MKTPCRKILPLLLALLLLLASCAGTVVPEGPTPAPPETAAPTAEAARTAAPTPSLRAAPVSSPEVTPSPVPPPSPSPSPTPAPAPSPTPTPEPAEEAPACTLSISCATLLDRLDSLDSAKAALVPADGWLLAPTQVTLEDGDSVFDLLQRACRANGVHMEFSLTPGLGSAYIEGIGNLYEFDCGDLSGWLFAVNGVSPNRGCSDVFPEAGDRIEWCYTCSLGGDLPHLTRG